MTNLESTLSHVGEARNAVMRSVFLFLCALAAMTLQAQEQKQDTTTVKNEKKEKKSAHQLRHQRQHPAQRHGHRLYLQPRYGHSRRGYADDKMNDNRLYWDATLTKSWKQGRWVAKLKGYDLLGQVTQWQYYVTSQGRTEYWTNNMRRYVLLSLAYRFSLTPKKK